MILIDYKEYYTKILRVIVSTTEPKLDTVYHLCLNKKYSCRLPNIIYENTLAVDTDNLSRRHSVYVEI